MSDNVAAVTEHFKKKLDARVVLAAEMIRAEAVSNAPVGRGEQVDLGAKKGTSKRLGGNLKSQITRKRIGHAHQRVVSGAGHSAHVEFGTAPHRITPNGKKALAFVAGGESVIVKGVNHPGTKPNPFMRRALRDAGPKIKSKLGLE